MVCLKRSEIFLSVVSDLPCSSCLKIPEDTQFLAVDSNHGTGLALQALFKVPGFQWYCSKWASQFTFWIFQYMPGLELLPCIINTNLNRQH